MNKKIISVKIDNKQLDALEDLLLCELSKSEEEKARAQIKKLWQLLVVAYDRTK